MANSCLPFLGHFAFYVLQWLVGMGLSTKPNENKPIIAGSVLLPALMSGPSISEFCNDNRVRSCHHESTQLQADTATQIDKSTHTSTQLRYTNPTVLHTVLGPQAVRLVNYTHKLRNTCSATVAQQ